MSITISFFASLEPIGGCLQATKKRIPRAYSLPFLPSTQGWNARLFCSTLQRPVGKTPSRPGKHAITDWVWSLAEIAVLIWFESRPKEVPPVRAG